MHKSHSAHSTYYISIVMLEEYGWAVSTLAVHVYIAFLGQEGCGALHPSYTHLGEAYSGISMATHVLDRCITF